MVQPTLLSVCQDGAVLLHHLESLIRCVIVGAVVVQFPATFVTLEDRLDGPLTDVVHA